MEYDDNNIFAKIIRKEANAEIVYENEYVLCFLDVFPRAPVHILIVPKKKYIDIYDFSTNSKTDEKTAIFDSFEKLIDKFNLQNNGCRIITNYGPNGRQEVQHLHFHLVGGKDVGRMLT